MSNDRRQQQQNTSSQPPQTPQERARWFVESSLDDTQALADFDGDVTWDSRR